MLTNNLLAGWNTLFYLWGVFRRRKVIGLDRSSVSSKNLFTPNLDVPSKNEDLPPAVLTYSENVSAFKSKDGGPSCIESVNTVPPCKSSSSVEEPVLSSSATKDVTCDAKTSISQRHNDVSISKNQDTRHVSCSLPGIPEGGVRRLPENQNTCLVCAINFKPTA